MSKLGIVTISVGELYEQMAKYTHPLMGEYAKKVKADFVVLDDYSSYEYPHYLKFEVQKMLTSKRFNRILFVDTDVVIKHNSPNLFDLVPANKLGAYEEGHLSSGKKTDKFPCMKMYERIYNDKMKELGLKKISLNNWDGKYYNSGVFLVNEHTNPFISPPGNIVKIGGFYDQNYFNMMIPVRRIKVHDITFKFNRYPWAWVDSKDKDMTKRCYFIHYAGLKNRLERMENDLKKMGYICKK